MTHQSISPIGLILFSTLSFMLMSAPSTFAQTVQFLGQTKLILREKDLDILKISRCQQPPIGSIKLKALRGAAEINTLVVRYGNNKTDRLPVRNKIQEGTETRWIELRGSRRCITGIAILGSTERSTNQTIIQFYGR